MVCKIKILTPNTPTFPLTVYGIGNLTAGLMTRQLSKQLKLGHVWVRVLSVYGSYDWKNSLIMSTIRKLGNHETPSLTKGEQVWDYRYSGYAAEIGISELTKDIGWVSNTVGRDGIKEILDE